MLRLAHDLSIASIADLLSLRSTGSVSPFESGRGIPSADILIDTADLFGVSVDWLSGRKNSQEPYQNDILLGLEQEHLNRLFYDIKHKDERHRDYGTWYVMNNAIYTDETKRIAAYSLAVRANIVFLFHYLKNETRTHDLIENPFKAKIKTFHDFKVIAIPMLLGIDEVKHEKHRRIAYRNFKILENLIDGKITTPVFDIKREDL